MTAEQIIAWARLFRARNVERAKKVVRMSCPLAEWRHGRGRDRKPSFAIMIQPGESGAHCLACHWKGAQAALLIELRHYRVEFDFALAMQQVTDAIDGADIAEIEDYETLRQQETEIEYPERMRLALLPAYRFEYDAREHEVQRLVHPYLTRRGVSFECAATFDIRYDVERKRVVFPIRDHAGVLRGLHGRSVRVNPDLPYLAYNHEDRNNLRFTWLGLHLVDRERTVVMTESVFDLTRTWEFYANVITPLRSEILASQFDRVQWCRRVVTFFDGDEAGDKARAYVRGALTCRVDHAHPPRGTDPGSLSDQEIAEILSPLLHEDLT